MHLTLPLAALAATLTCAANAQDSKPAPVPAAALRSAPAGPQQPPSQEKLIQLRDEKLALPVFKKAAWTFDYDKAKAEAKKSGKLIFTYFSRSYAH